MKICIHLTLLILHVIVLVSSETSCPKRCVCRTRRVQKLGQTFYVNCKRRGFTKIPDLSSLKTNGLPKRLDLSHNRIKSISKNDFPTGLNVAMLFLESNENIRLRDEAFVNLADSLQFLGLHSIHLQFSSPFTFLRGLGKLEKLILNFNTQRDDGVISANLFKDLGLSSLKELSMYNCRIGDMEDGVFAGIEHIEELDLTFNWLKEVPSAIKTLHNLKKIHLRLNSIKTIEGGSFKGMTSLSELILSDNGDLQVVNGSLAGLENVLTSLTMRNCELNDVPYEGIKTLKKLEILNIGYNPLVDMSSKSLVGSYCLKTLDISKTLFPLQPSILEPQKDCLINLFLNDRGLTDIPRHFLLGLTKLHHVSLTKNQISVLRPDSLKDIKAKAYELSDNPLVKIENGTFTGLSSGISLGIKRTNITDLHFVLDYPDKTFLNIWLEGTNVSCDCTVYEAMKKGEPWTLEGQCLLRGERKDLKDIEFKTFLRSNCTELEDNEKYSVKEEEVVQKSVSDTNGGNSQKANIYNFVLFYSIMFMEMCNYLR